MKNLDVWLLILFALLAAGCTVTEKIVDSERPSFDNGRPNSGFYGWGEHDGQRKGMISSLALKRYNGLIEIYGDRYPGGMGAGFGISEGYEMDTVRLYWITKDALVRFVEMQGWQRNGEAP
jgi:hypothetical protein